MINIFYKLIFLLLITSINIQANTKTDIDQNPTIIKEVDKMFLLTYYNMGMNYGKLGQYKKAIKVYEKVITINPQDSYAYYNMGIDYGKLEEYEKAISSYKKVIELNPEDYQAYTNLFEIQLISNLHFDKELESKYINLFKEEKNYFIVHDMLKLLSQLSHNKKVDINIWVDTYKEQSLSDWSFTELETWAKKKDYPLKEKLLDAIEVFKTKQ